jgi:hypothetical protein
VNHKTGGNHSSMEPMASLVNASSWAPWACKWLSKGKRKTDRRVMHSTAMQLISVGQRILKGRHTKQKDPQPRSELQRWNWQGQPIAHGCLCHELSSSGHTWCTV